MQFEIEQNGDGKNTIVVLRDKANNCKAEIFSFGAILNNFCVEKDDAAINVIDGFASPGDAEANITNGFKSAKLSPFVCRLTDGKYFFEGKEYSVNKFFLGNEAIHGLIYDTVFAIKICEATEEKASVTFVCTYSKNENFPFDFTIEITYTLHKNNLLTLQTKVLNTGNTLMPLNDGWHPYFKIGESVNDLYFKMNSDKMVEFNDRLVPTGNFIDYSNFSSFHKIGETFLDNSFILNLNAEPACILQNRESGIELKIIADSSYPYLQVYTPPYRTSIAIENLSSPPDSFNNGIDLIILKPNEEKIFTTNYCINLLS